MVLNGGVILESWKDIVGYEGLYEISNFGRVRSHENKITYSVRHGERKWKQRIIKQYVHPTFSGYKVDLYKNKKRKCVQVHRLVAEAFLDNPKNYPVVNHIDGNRLNNNVNNLEWCDHKYNANHAFDNDLTTSNDKIILVNIETQEQFHFRSKSLGSKFLGKSVTYISNNLVKGRNILCGYKVIEERRPR